jgi:molybdenum cofactor synthesis domain-containing protein
MVLEARRIVDQDLMMSTNHVAVGGNSNTDRLLDHDDVSQNCIDLYNRFSYDDAAQYVYGMEYSAWKQLHMKPTTAEQLQKYQASLPLHAKHDTELLQPRTTVVVVATSPVTAVATTSPATATMGTSDVTTTTTTNVAPTRMEENISASPTPTTPMTSDAPPTIAVPSPNDDVGIKDIPVEETEAIPIAAMSTTTIHPVAISNDVVAVTRLETESTTTNLDTTTTTNSTTTAAATAAATAAVNTTTTSTSNSKNATDTTATKPVTFHSNVCCVDIDDDNDEDDIQDMMDPYSITATTTTTAVAAAKNTSTNHTVDDTTTNEKPSTIHQSLIQPMIDIPEMIAYRNEQFPVIAIVTISDRAYAGIYPDQSGPMIADTIRSVPGIPSDLQFIMNMIVPDDMAAIQAKIRTICNNGSDIRVDCIITTGGTGFGIRDVTPEATREIITYELINFIPFILSSGTITTTTTTTTTTTNTQSLLSPSPNRIEKNKSIHNPIYTASLLSRGVVGVISSSSSSTSSSLLETICDHHTLIVNLPGSPTAIQEMLPILLPYLLHMIVELQHVTPDILHIG